ncbi:MAG: MopE-related protein [Pseudomonadota bacterium]
MSPRCLLILALPLATACTDPVSTRDPHVNKTDADDDGFYEDEDCDDDDPLVHPGGDERCDGKDNDCDGFVDAADDSLSDGLILYDDRDHDGYGDPATEVVACEALTGTAENGDDCDDTRDSVNPGVHEDCTTTWDDNCSGDAFDLDADNCATFYPDADGDGFGGEDAACTCFGNPDYPMLAAGDCDDTAPEVNPDAAEVCDDGIDNDCDGSAGACQWQGDIDMEDAYDARILGAAEDDGAGTDVWGVGDLDGDSHEDLLVLAPGADGGVGNAVVFYWQVSGIEPFSGADGRVVGGSGEPIAYAVPGGDLDGDGVPDVILGSSSANGGAGAVWLWSAPGGATDDITSLGVSLQGGSGAQAGMPMGLGDLDDDGHDDFAVAAPGERTLYLVYGPWTTSSALSDAGLGLRGATGGVVALAGRGDTDADGLNDFAVGLPSASSAGEVFVAQGPGSGLSSLYDAQGILSGAAAEDEFGAAVGWAGDLDGDGYDELLVGAPGAEIDFGDQGRVYLFQGPVTGLLDAAGGAVATLDGESSNDRAGATVRGGGDINGDGSPDLIMAATGNDQAASSAGLVYVMYGPLAGGSYELKFADAFFEPEVQSRQYAGTGLWIGSDFDADGVDDVLIGSPGNDQGAESAGAVDLFLSHGL